MKRTIPYGYEFRDGYIGVEKTASSVVRGIYIEYLNGKSFATIAKELTAKGIDYYQGKTEWNVLIDTGTDICIAHLEAQLKEQENDMMRVVRICAERGNQKEFEGEFKRINANITELHQIIEVEKTKIRPTLDIESRLDRLFEQITAASADMENFENSLIRQLVAQVRVESAEELTIILHNGFRTTAKI